MSDYNARLKHHAHKGPVDLKEERHAPQRVAAAAAAVAHILKEREGWTAQERERCPVVVLTGAGISTAAGIPDFRGPHGVWTAEACGRAAPAGTSLEFAQPTFSHMALVALQGRGVVDAVISQNIDGLHLRSGLPPGCLYELHGNSFMERCRRCHKTHFRPFDVNGMSFKPTGRCCEGLRSAAARQKRARDDDGSGAFEACGGELHDFMLDWGDALPAAQLKASERLCQRALCLLCLGTSLYINPCGLLPTRTKKSGGKVVIVSLSATAQDAIADVVSRAEADEFLAQLCTVLDVPVPRFVPALTFYVAQACARVPNFGVNTVNWRVAVSACSDAQPSPLPHLVRATARVRSAVAAAGGGSACSTPPPASPPAAVCKLESVCDDGSARTRWLFEGQAEASGSALHVSLELVWHSAVSCAPSFAAERHDSSVMELELVPDSGAGCATAPAAATCVAAPRQRHGWHQIGRYSVEFPVENGAVLECGAAVQFARH